MSDYLFRLAARAMGRSTVLQPLIPFRFAPGPDVMPTPVPADTTPHDQRAEVRHGTTETTGRVGRASQKAKGKYQKSKCPEAESAISVENGSPEQQSSRQLVQRTASTSNTERPVASARPEFRQAATPVEPGIRNANPESSGESRTRETHKPVVPAPRVREHSGLRASTPRADPDQPERSEVPSLPGDGVSRRDIGTRSGLVTRTESDERGAMNDESRSGLVTRNPQLVTRVARKHVRSAAVRPEAPARGEATLVPIRPRAAEGRRGSASRDNPLPFIKPPAPEPTVHVTIGRIEVRAIQPEPSRPGPSRPRSPRLSLADYLKREGERRQ
jgi:hypothetical protein